MTSRNCSRRWSGSALPRRLGVPLSGLAALISEIEEQGLSDGRPLPDEQVADQDLIEAIQEEFSEEELQILTLWLDDLKRAQIGERLGENPDAIRFRLKRAFERVRRRFRAES